MYAICMFATQLIWELYYRLFCSPNLLLLVTTLKRRPKWSCSVLQSICLTLEMDFANCAFQHGLNFLMYLFLPILLTTSPYVDKMLFLFIICFWVPVSPILLNFGIAGRWICFYLFLVVCMSNFLVLVKKKHGSLWTLRGLIMLIPSIYGSRWVPYIEHEGEERANVN